MHDLMSIPFPRRDLFSSGHLMDKLYYGLGAALYLMFVAWCIITPQK
jgi:hypothetical protein